jgi:hypothetical protein
MSDANSENMSAKMAMFSLGYLTVRVDRWYVNSSCPYYLGQVIECDSKVVNSDDWIWFPINAGGGDKECPIRIIHERDIKGYIGVPSFDIQLVEYS